MFMTRSFSVTPKTTEQHLTARSDKSVAYVTNNKRLCSTFCTIEASYWQTWSTARPLCVLITNKFCCTCTDGLKEFSAARMSAASDWEWHAASCRRFPTASNDSLPDCLLTAPPRCSPPTHPSATTSGAHPAAAVLSANIVKCPTRVRRLTVRKERAEHKKRNKVGRLVDYINHVLWGGQTGVVVGERTFLLLCYCWTGRYELQ